VGLKDEDGSMLVDPSVLPWSFEKKPAYVKPSDVVLRAEVSRRYMLCGSIISNVAPCPKAWMMSHA
jgi:hypothetical protein